MKPRPKEKRATAKQVKTALKMRSPLDVKIVVDKACDDMLISMQKVLKQVEPKDHFLIISRVVNSLVQVAYQPILQLTWDKVKQTETQQNFKILSAEPQESDDTYDPNEISPLPPVVKQ